MRYDFGYQEEQKLGKPYDLRLLKRLLPLARPHWHWLISSVILIVVLALLDLSLPYVIKIAIDQHIVPVHKNAKTDKGATFDQENRTLQVSLQDRKIRKIVADNAALFKVEGHHATILHRDLRRLDPKDLMQLRKGDLAGLGWLTLVYFSFILMDFGMNFVQTLIMEYAGQTIMHELRLKLFNHIQSLSLSFFNRNPIARLVTRVTNDVQNMHEFFTNIISFFFKDLFLLVGIAALLLVMNWKLALACFAVLPMVAFLAMGFSARIRDVFRELRIKVAEINTRFAETIGGIKVIQSFCREAENYNFFQTLNHKNYRLGMRQIHIFAIFMPVIEVIGVLTVALLIYFGGQKVLNDQISLGVLVAFISYIRMFFRPIRDLAEKYNILQNAMASAERIFHLLDSNETLPLVEMGPLKSDQSGGVLRNITFDKVTFAYNEDQTILKDVSFSLERGQTLAIVGPTGSGKTSLIHLLIRFYDPLSGRILIDGKDIRLMTSKALTSKMALVSQDPFLFADSIYENIFSGKNHVSPKEVKQVLEAAHCDALVSRQPNKLETILSEGGASLSSGERQLISIARAFARDPQLIILDEATSYIDSETELQLQKALTNLMAGRTAIIVAHRLSTARSADVILVLNRGRIVESGSHAQLMDQKGFYFHLNRLQQGYERA
jgi:ATP-binding cassette, subfamily B, multidrug efflux pump